MLVSDSSSSAWELCGAMGERLATVNQVVDLLDLRLQRLGFRAGPG